MGRSGTSLVQAMLHAHPLVAMMPETHFFRQYLTPARRLRRLEAEGPAALVRRLGRDRGFREAHLDPGELLSPWLSGSAAWSLPAVYQRLLTRHAEAHGATHAGDKDPLFCEDLAVVYQLFPAARIVHVVRDPRDVRCSRARVAWGGRRPWWLDACVCAEQLARARRHGARFGARYVELRYEDLLDAPEQTLRSVCDVLGLPWSSAMLAFGEAGRELVPPRELEWKANTLGPLLGANTGGWRRDLSPLEVRFVEGVHRPLFRAGEYAVAGEPGLTRMVGGLAAVLRPVARVAYTPARRLHDRVQGTLGRGGG